MSVSPAQSDRETLQRPVHPSERRTQPRFSWKGTVSLRILPDGPDLVGVLLDMSEGGCGVEMGMAIPAAVGDKVHVNLNVQGLTLKRVGILRNIQVIRQVERETRAGIEFIAGSGLSAEQFRQLTRGMYPLAEKSSPNGSKDTSKRGWWAWLSGSNS